MTKFAVALMLIAALVLAGCGQRAAPEPVAPTPTQLVAPTPTETSAATQPAVPSPTVAPATPELESEDEDDYPEPPEIEDEDGYPAPAVPTVPAPEAYPEPEVAAPTPARAWEFDGVISEGEYTGQATIGPITVYWAHDGEYLYIAAEAETNGWLGVGLAPDSQMRGADFIIAVHDGQPQIWDAYGQGATGPTHPPDTQIGGTFDLVEWAVVRDGTWLRFEALRPLDSGDPYDKPLAPGGTYPMIVAVGSSPAFDAMHSYRGRGEISLD